MRKYTLNYYLEFLEEQNSKKFLNKLKKYINNVIPKIEERYKKLSKAFLIDYVSRYEDFYMITTYRTDNLLPVGINIIRYKNGKKIEQFYRQDFINYFSADTYWLRGKMNYFTKRYLYCDNLKELFKESEFNYSEVWNLGKKIDLKIRHLLYFCETKEIKVIESLTKIGCYKLARDIMNGKYSIIDCKDLVKSLRIPDKNFLKKIKQEDFGAYSLIIYKRFLDLSLPDKYFKYLKGFFKSYYNLERFDGFTHKAFVDYYLEQIKQKLYKGCFCYFYQDYRDYIFVGKKLNYNFKDSKFYRPFNFKVAHDNAVNKLDSVKNKELYSKVNKELRKYQCLNFEDKKYLVVMPIKAEDIITEGQQMMNCVGSYLGRIKDKKSIICFIRKIEERDKSFYTLELNPKDFKVVQCRGFHNNPTSEEYQVKKFVSKWLKEIVEKNVMKLSREGL
ncbi:MAG: PcfJ domain-containing protein [Clostridia bacterium]|nr:PcfJ domain-containing protein [Clostridia bacterium]